MKKKTFFFNVRKKLVDFLKYSITFFLKRKKRKSSKYCCHIDKYLFNSNDSLGLDNKYCKPYADTMFFTVKVSFRNRQSSCCQLILIQASDTSDIAGILFNDKVIKTSYLLNKRRRNSKSRLKISFEK